MEENKTKLNYIMIMNTNKWIYICMHYAHFCPFNSMSMVNDIGAITRNGARQGTTICEGG